MLGSAGNRDVSAQDILRKAPLVSSPKEDQFSAALVDQMSSLAQTGGARSWGPRGRKPPSKTAAQQGQGEAVLTARRQTAAVRSSLGLVHGQAHPYLASGGVQDTLHYSPPSLMQACTIQIASRSDSPVLSSEGDRGPREGGHSMHPAFSASSCDVSGSKAQ